MGRIQTLLGDVDFQQVNESIGHLLHDVAGGFIRRHIPSVEVNARRIRGGDATRIKRYDRILGIAGQS